MQHLALAAKVLEGFGEGGGTAAAEPAEGMGSERAGVLGHGLEDSFGEGSGGRFAGRRGLLEEGEGRSRGLGQQVQGDVLLARSGAVLDGEEQVGAVAAEVEIRVPQPWRSEDPRRAWPGRSLPERLRT
jgi:hypothetical protein